MGNGSSSNIKSVKISQEKHSGPRSDDNNAKVNTSVSKHNRIQESENATDNERRAAVTADSDAEIETLTKQLTESESQRLDLDDRVQTLEERLEYLSTQTIIAEDKTCDETLHAKDQYIAKLEREKADIVSANKKLKTQCRKKVKRLTTQISEQKQEANFQMMEIFEDLERLREENGRLQLNQQATGGTGVPVMSDGVPVPGGEKMTLILQLSEQVTEQSEKISKLEQKVQEKNQIIEELRTKLRNNAEYIKVRDDHETTKNADLTSNSSKHNSGNRRANKIKVQPIKASATSVKNGVDIDKNGINSLFDVNDGDDDTENMVKLTSLLQGVKATSDKVRLSSDSLDYVDHDDNLGKGEGRSFSGTSRDSGLGSASKQGGKMENKKSEMYSEWKEPSFSLESGLSDSDWDRDSALHSKISSAPPKLQGVVRQKKKSSSLKTRISGKKPAPSLAFVDDGNEGSQDSQGSGLDRHHLAPILSTVHVT